MTGKKIIEIASKYLGQNGRKFCKDYGLPWGSHWCCAFVYDIFRIAKASKLFYSGQKTAYVPTAQAWLKAHCKHVKMADARPGDIVIFTWHGGGYNKGVGTRDHIGFIRKKGTSQVAYTIEGNTGGSGPTTSKVMKRTRSVKYIFAIYRPKYEVKTTTKTRALKDVAKQAKKRGKEHHKYKLGGWSWTKGIECHAFTGTVFKECGYPKVYKILRKKGFWRKFNSDAYLGKYRVAYNRKGVPASKMVPGDILLSSKVGHHSAIYIGDGLCAEAVRSGTRVAKVGRRFRYVYRVTSLCPEKKKKKAKTVEHKGTYVVLYKKGVSVRKTHNTNSKKVGAIAYGKTFKVTKKHGNWVYASGLKGWVCIKGKKGTYIKKK